MGFCTPLGVFLTRGSAKFQCTQISTTHDMVNHTMLFTHTQKTRLIRRVRPISYKTGAQTLTNTTSKRQRQQSLFLKKKKCNLVTVKVKQSQLENVVYMVTIYVRNVEV